MDQFDNKERETRLTSIDCLNDDILLRVFDYLHFDDRIRLRRTSSRWKSLLERQLQRTKALRIGFFQQGGYQVTSGLQMKCSHQTAHHRRQTGVLFNDQLLNMPADPETLCFSVNHYDFLHRSLKCFHQSITMLSLGHLNISYRLLMVIVHNLPKLEHLELINCATASEDQASGICSTRRRSSENLPSIESFNSQPLEDQYTSTRLYNQHADEQENVQERLARQMLVKSCELVKESKARNFWPNMSHLLVKDSNSLNEFSLSLLLAVTSQTLLHLAIESNQYLTGEFLNYCGPKLKILSVKYCPLIQLKFLEDYVKIKQLLSPQAKKPIIKQSTIANEHLNRSLNQSRLIYHANSHQEIHCTL